LTKLVGTLPSFDRENITKFFRGVYLTKARDSISSYLINKGVSILEINAYLIELSEHLKDRITPTLDEYGIRLINFFVNDINVPEDDPAVKTLRDALAKRAEMDIIGFNYVQERSFDTLEGAATNPGSGQAGVMGAGMGLGMGLGLGGAMGGQVGGLAQSLNVNEIKKCPGCNADIDASSRFCPSCGLDTKATGAVNANDSTTCAECGTKFSRKYRFCTECGDPYNPCTFCGEDIKADGTACHVCGKSAPKPCPKCGTPITDEKKNFCPECGESLARKCGKCGTQIEGEAKFCRECGSDLKEI